MVYLLGILFTTYTFLLLVRVFGSWFPSFSRSQWMRFVSFYTDPYLNLFRKIIPPIGVLDLSPMFAFIFLQLIQWVVFAIFK